MAKIPTLKQIRPEEFPQVEWLPQFLAPLNRFFEETTRALNKALTINENFDGMVKRVTVDGTFPLKFTWDKSNKPVAAWIGQCREIDEDHTTITTALYLDWEYVSNSQGNFFQINNIAGLSASASNKFYAQIIAITG